MFLLKLTEALRQQRVPYAIVGGYAVAFHGAVRGTVDVDIVLRFTERDFVAVEKALATIDLQPRLPLTAREVFRFREEYIANRNLSAWTFVNPASPAEIVDVILTQDLAEMTVVRRRVRGKTIRLASIDDLIAMKRECGRPQDVEDVRALEKLR